MNNEMADDAGGTEVHLIVHLNLSNGDSTALCGTALPHKDPVINWTWYTGQVTCAGCIAQACLNMLRDCD